MYTGVLGKTLSSSVVYYPLVVFHVRAPPLPIFCEHAVQAVLPSMLKHATTNHIGTSYIQAVTRQFETPVYGRWPTGLAT